MFTWNQKLLESGKFWHSQAMNPNEKFLLQLHTRQMGVVVALWCTYTQFEAVLRGTFNIAVCDSQQLST